MVVVESLGDVFIRGRNVYRVRAARALALEARSEFLIERFAFSTCSDVPSLDVPACVIGPSEPTLIGEPLRLDTMAIEIGVLKLVLLDLVIPDLLERRVVKGVTAHLVIERPLLEAVVEALGQFIEMFSRDSRGWSRTVRTAGDDRA